MMTKRISKGCFQNTGFGWWNEGEIAECLRVPGGGDSTKANLVVETYVIEADTTPKIGGVCFTLGGTRQVPIVVEQRVYDPSRRHGYEEYDDVCETGTATTLTAQEKERPLVGTSVVRRLTPKECERLQQFPDDWSRWGINEKGEVYELSDSARYRLQGNSIARPFWTWLMRRIGANFERQPTLGSLFDGQAGFPLCAVEAGIKPVWASEIEKHAVAVVKYHFGDEEAGITGDWKDYIFSNTKGGSD